jgi:peroxiredoxin
MTTLETVGTPIGSYAPDFELPGVDHQVHHLRRYLERLRAVSVIAMCNHCPYVQLYVDKLKNIQAEFAEQGFTLIGVNGSDANIDPTESFENMKSFARRHDLNFPYLWDSTQDVTRSFGVTKTPTAFLIDWNGVVRYKGQIDDNPHNSQQLVGEQYLKRAITSLFNEQEIYPVQTETIGTPLILRK